MLLEHRELMAQGEDLNLELESTAEPCTKRCGERNENGRHGAEAISLWPATSTRRTRTAFLVGTGFENSWKYVWIKVIPAHNPTAKLT
jgi:hypothetical protein